MNKIKIPLDWFPPAELRGNSRANRHKKADIFRQAKNLAMAQSVAIIKNNEPCALPIYGSLAAHIDAYYPRSIDLDNLLIGYKPIFDGFEAGGLFLNDRFIKKLSIELHSSREKRSVITLEYKHS